MGDESVAEVISIRVAVGGFRELGNMELYHLGRFIRQAGDELPHRYHVERYCRVNEIVDWRELFGALPP